MPRIQKPCACKQHYETVAYFLINIFSPIKQTKALRMIVMCKWLKWKAADATRKKKMLFSMKYLSLMHDAAVYLLSSSPPLSLEMSLKIIVEWLCCFTLFSKGQRFCITLVINLWVSLGARWFNWKQNCVPLKFCFPSSNNFLCVCELHGEKSRSRKSSTFELLRACRNDVC